MENKELFRDISDIKEDVAGMDAKLDQAIKMNDRLESTRDRVINVENKANSAHRRLDKLDKWIFAIGSTVILAVVGAVISLIII